MDSQQVSDNCPGEVQLACPSAIHLSILLFRNLRENCTNTLSLQKWVLEEANMLVNGITRR